MMTTTQKALQAYIDVKEGKARFYSKAAEIYGIDRKLVSYVKSVIKKLTVEEEKILCSRIKEDKFLYFSNREKTKSLEVAAKLLNDGYKLIDSEVDEVTAVYVLKSDKYYKIGVSSAISKRIGMLQTGNPYTIELIHQKYFTSSVEAYKEEKRLHLLYKDKQVQREWFELTLEDIEYIQEISHGK